MMIIYDDPRLMKKISDIKYFINHQVIESRCTSIHSNNTSQSFLQRNDSNVDTQQKVYVRITNVVQLTRFRRIIILYKSLSSSFIIPPLYSSIFIRLFIC